MDSAKTTRTHHHKPSPLSHAAIQSSSSSSSTLNSNRKARAARIDAHSQRTRSVIAESLDYFLPKGNNNPSLVRTVSDSRKLSQSQVGLEVTEAKPNLNPDKERWGRKLYGGEILKLIYDTSKVKTRRKAEAVNGPQQQEAVDEEEAGVGDVKRILSQLEIAEVNKIKGVRNDDEGDLKRIYRRRSFCGDETSLDSFLSSNGSRIVAVDMPPFMQIHAIDCARRAYDSLEKFTSKSLALSLKKEFDVVYGPAWHCIVGTSFGSFVTHSVGGFLYFSLDHKMYILLFKTTVQRAD